MLDPAPESLSSPQVHKIIVVWWVGHVEIVPLVLLGALTVNQTSKPLTLHIPLSPYSGERFRTEQSAAGEDGLLCLCQV